MEQGLLWFDDSKRTLTEKVKLAANHFQKKYGRTPDLCLVHPSMFNADTEGVVPFYGVDIHIRPYRPVPPGHLWVGLDEEPAYTESSRQANASQVREKMKELVSDATIQPEGIGVSG
jgi:hypothetical protein